MYLNPFINEQGVFINAFSYTGDSITDINQTDITALKIGYIINELFTSLYEFLDISHLIDVSSVDIENLYLQVNNEDIYKIENKVTTTILKYSISYESVSPYLLLANTTLNRYNYFMPKWSSAFKNNISTYSKIFYPVFEEIEKFLTDIHYQTATNLELKEALKEIIIKKEITQVSQNSNPLLLTSNISKTPNNSLELKEKLQVNKNLNSPPLPFNNTESTPFIFIKNLNTSQDIISLKGLDFNNNYIEEVLTVDYNKTVKSAYKFKTVTNLESLVNNYIFSNHIEGLNFIEVKDDINFSYLTDEKKDFTHSFEFKIVERDTYNYDLEIYSLPKNYSCIYAYNLNLKEGFQSIPKVFIDKFGTIIVHCNNSIYSTVIRDPIEKLTLIPSNNNNNIVYLENDSQLVNDTFTFVVDITELRKISEETFIYLKLDINGTTYYLDNNYELQTMKSKYFLKDNQNKIHFDYEYSEDSTYSLTLISNGISYMSSTYTRTLGLKKISNLNITDLIFNGKIYIGELDNEFYRIEFYKDAYEVDILNKRLYVEKDNNLKIIYKDFTEDSS